MPTCILIDDMEIRELYEVESGFGHIFRVCKNVGRGVSGEDMNALTITGKVLIFFIQYFEVVIADDSS